MADIPGANPDPTVAPDRMPTPYDDNHVTPEAFGAGVGTLVQQQGGELAKVGSEYQQRANAVADEAAFGKAQALLNDKILNENTGYLGLKGGDALKQSDKYTGDFTSGIDTIRQGLTPAQWQRVGFRIDRVREAGLRIAATHERQQHDVIADATFHGAELASTDALAQMAGDPKTTRAQMSKALGDLILSGENRARYKYGDNPSPAAVQAESIPLLNRASVQAMSEALSTQDPQHAADALMLFGPYLGVHAKQYTSAVNAMLAQQTVAHQGEKILGAATTPVPLPDGTKIAALDAGKLSAGLSDLKPDAPHAAEIVKYVEQQQQRLGKAWEHTVEQQKALARKEADPTAMGRIDVSLINPARRVFLRDYADEELTKLQNIQSTQNKRDANGPEAQKMRTQAFADAQSIFGTTRASDTTFNDFLNSPTSMKADDGRALTLAETLSGPDQKKFAAEFEKKREKEAADKPLDSHAVGLVKQSLVDALGHPAPGVQMALTDEQMRQRDSVMDHVREQRNAWKTANPQKEPADEQYRDWINEWVGTVPGSALPGFWHWSDRARVDIELQRVADARAATPAPQPAAASATPAPPQVPQVPIAPLVPPQPDEQDKDALDWLQKNPTGPAADKVRAKLKAKGLVQ